MKKVPDKHPKIIVIVGPTGSGKTALSIMLAKRFRGEIISADSRQVYRGLNIGTEKISKKEMRGIPHHLIDVSSVRKVFSASDFKKLADQTMVKILRSGKLPMVVGGTGFYIDALFGAALLPDVPPNLQLRKRLEKKSAAHLFNLLEKKDPRRAKTIDKNNPRRLMRALEIAEALGKVPVPKKTEQHFNVLWIGLTPDPKTYERALKTRLEKQLKRGLLSEIRKLKKSGITEKRINELGLEYRTGLAFLHETLSRTEMKEVMLRELQQYAKRQMTWFKRNSKIHWFNPKRRVEIVHEVERHLRS